MITSRFEPSILLLVNIGPAGTSVGKDSNGLSIMKEKLRE
jgi:hypothetical protein